MFHPNSDWPQLAALGSSSPIMSPFFVRPYPHSLDLNWLTMQAAARRFQTPILPYPHMMLANQPNRTLIRPVPTINSNNSRRSSFSVDNLLNHFNVERPETKTPQNQPKSIELKIYDSENDSEGMPVCKKRCFNVHQREGMKIVNDMDLQLPKDLKFIHITIAEVDYCGVFCANENGIQCNKRYGPLIQSTFVHSSNEAHSSSDVENSWMNYVLNTLDENQANMVKLTDVDKVYFEVSKTILVGEQLYVLEFLEKPLSTPKSVNEKLRTMDDDSDSILPDSQSDVTKLGSSEASADDVGETKGFQCERCGKVFSYKYYRDKHLKYTRCVDKGDRKFPCHLCSRSFEKRDRLRIHILHVHEKHRPHCCTVCGKRFSQSSSLNKHLRVHSGERPYKCVYCSKAFTASSILRTHIRQHSGEKPFKCKFCGKAFASHAAHDSHVRRTHTAPKPETHNCPLCKKSFQHSSHLKFHLQCIHGNWSMLSDREASVV